MFGVKSTTVAFVALLLATFPIVHGTHYYYENGTSYFISSPMIKNWHQAQRYCTFQGMHLVSINTPEENDIIMKIVEQVSSTSPNGHFWTSGTNAGHTDKEWYWMETGAPILYTNWIEGAPSTSTHNCILLHGGSHKFKWYDQLCGSNHHFICQDILTIPNTLKSQRCQSEL